MSRLRPKGTTFYIISAATAGIGANWARPIPLLVIVLPLTMAWLYRKPRAWALLAVVFILASHFGAKAEAGLVEPLRATYEGQATLVGDPNWFGTSLRVDLKIGNYRYEAWAGGTEAARLSPLLMGEKVILRGRLGPLSPQASWLRTRHIVGRVAVAKVLTTGPASQIHGAANGLRRLLEQGSKSLGYERQALFLGLVIGDDRNQSDALADAFAGSGLTHLLAVSGSNVAFVVSLAKPLLSRLRPHPRWLVTLALLAFFVLVTRFEPSVLRAGVMAALATTGSALGFRSQTKVLLALSVMVLVMIDPFLVDSLAFQLSVAASAGILWFSEGLTKALAPFGFLANPLAVTTAAQLAVAPILIPTFGSMPLAALPANILAAPVAGPVMMWGLGAGLPAGLFPPQLATVLHLPTRTMVWWIDQVARRSAQVPLGSIRMTHLVLILVAALAIRYRWYFDATAVYVRIATIVVLALAITHPVVESLRLPPPVVQAGENLTIYRSGGATVVSLGGATSPQLTLAELRETNVRHIDVLVSQYGGRKSAEVAAAISEVYGPKLILAPAGHRVRGGSAPQVGDQIKVGGLMLLVGSTTPQLEVVVCQYGALAGRLPL